MVQCLQLGQVSLGLQDEALGTAETQTGESSRTAELLQLEFPTERALSDFGFPSQVRAGSL